MPHLDEPRDEDAERSRRAAVLAADAARGAFGSLLDRAAGRAAGRADGRADGRSRSLVGVAPAAEGLAEVVDLRLVARRRLGRAGDRPS